MTRSLVLGASRGIGLEIVKQLAARGEKVVATCRRPAPALSAVEGVQVCEGIDITDRASLDRLAAELEAGSIDALWIVAGVLKRVTLDALDVEVIREQFEVNALGPLQATAALLGSLADNAKIGLITSRMGSIADNSSGGSYGYRMSKAALNMAGRSLANDLRERGIAVRLLHPGWVRTEMTGGTGHIDAAESAAGLIARIDDLTIETTGTFFHQNGEELPW